MGSDGPGSPPEASRRADPARFRLRLAALASVSVLIATWNVNSLKARLPRVEEWLDQTRPDVVCLQETKLTDKAFPALAFSALGYDIGPLGQGQWNGVAILSRVGIEEPLFGFADGHRARRRRPADRRPPAAGCGSTASTCPTAARSVTITTSTSCRGSAGCATHLAADLQPAAEVVVAGDWNIIPADIDVWDPSAFIGSTHVTPEERTALAEVKAWGLVDTFRQRYGDDARPVQLLRLHRRPLPQARRACGSTMVLVERRRWPIAACST